MLANIRTLHKLLALVGCMLVFSIAVALLGVRGMNVMRDELQTVYRESLMPLTQLEATMDGLNRVRFFNLVDATTETKDPMRADAAGRIAEYRKVIQQQWSAYLAGVTDEKEKDLASRVTGAAETYNRLIDQSHNFAEAGERDKAYGLSIGESRKVFLQLSKDVRDLIALQDQQGREEYEKASNLYSATLVENVTIVLVGVGAACLLAFLIGRSVVGPIDAMTKVMAALSAGERQLDVPFTEGTNEIALMAKSVQVFKDGLIRAERLEAEANEQQRVEIGRAKRREDLAASFEQMVSRLLESVGRTVAQVHATSDQLKNTAEEASSMSARVASAAEQTAANVQTVASATEELSSSTQEISSQVANSSRISQVAVGEIGSAAQTVEALRLTAEKIGDIVNLIQDIAGQTNLLALNATIEAARAGEAGKGFAVVAGEVKGLASQTARATGDIQEQISGVQASTRAAVDAIERARSSVGQVDTVVTSIAGAVEEQNAVTHEISRNVHEVSLANTDVSKSIADVSRSAGETGHMAGALYQTATALKGEASQLRDEVARFLAAMRAA